MAVVVVIGGCATLPTGPSVMVLPAHGKSFEQFQSDDALCRQWARQQIGMSPQETVNQNAVTGAAVGTAVGAGLGAAIGAASGQSGRRRGNRCREWTCCWGVVRCKCGPGLWLGSAAPIRHLLSAVYVCQGECDPGESSRPENNAASATSPGL